jgi:hypothetical protein
MATIPAEEVEINIHDGFWQLIPSDESVLSARPVFQVTRGSGVMEYTPAFGEAHKLPGTVLSVEYVRAVVIGYEEKTRRWLLGFHVARGASDEARWLELVRWPSGDNMLYGAAAQQAGRDLAEYVGCPLKIFGAKKLTRPLTDASARGVTGPLVPHQREDIRPQQVKLLAQSIDLPIQYPHMWLGRARTGVTLRLSKEATASKKGEIAPSFNQCVIDPEQGSIRLLPPTGLLGAFLGGQQGRVLKASGVRNVELRHTIARRSVPQEDTGDMVTEMTYITHVWEVYLTLPDESLLLAQTTHVTSSELSRKRVTAGDKFSVDSGAGIEYLRRHQADQEAYDMAANWAEAAAIVIASTLGVHLAKTQVEQEAS